MTIDKENVINGLKCCSSKGMSACASEKCPYYPDKYEWDECTSQLANDALELLKEQEPLVIHKCGFAATCPECNLSWMMWQPDHMRYCPYCGKAMKWDE